MFFIKRKKCNSGHFWFADLVCLRIVERGKWKVFRRIKYALFYFAQQETASDKAAQHRATEVLKGDNFLISSISDLYLISILISCPLFG